MKELEKVLDLIDNLQDVVKDIGHNLILQQKEINNLKRTVIEHEEKIKRNNN